jgi:hypothetical protein
VVIFEQVILFPWNVIVIAAACKGTARGAVSDYVMSRNNDTNWGAHEVCESATTNVVMHAKRVASLNKVFILSIKDPW